MKDALKNLKKHWITVWLIVVAVILAGTFISRAVYTEVSSVKRVVTTKSSPKVLFSSNCLYAECYERRMPSKEYSISINNFDMNSPEVPNPDEIKYTLTAQLKVKYNNQIMTFSELAAELDGDTETYNAIVARATVPDESYDSEQPFGYFIGKSQENNASGIIDSPEMIKLDASNGFQFTFGSSSSYETLPGGSRSTDRFKAEVPSRDFEKTDPEFYIYVKADPDDTNLPDIYALLYGAKNEVITAAWSGQLAESNTGSDDYDFYNYIISGSGSGKLDIIWDPEWFEIDDFFFNSSLSGVVFDGSSTPSEIDSVTIDGVTYTGTNSNKLKKVTIVVDSQNSKSRYEIQLYKKRSDTPYIGDHDAANYIHCKLQESGGSGETTEATEATEESNEP